MPLSQCVRAKRARVSCFGSQINAVEKNYDQTPQIRHIHTYNCPSISFRFGLPWLNNTIVLIHTYTLETRSPTASDCLRVILFEVNKAELED